MRLKNERLGLSSFLSGLGDEAGRHGHLLNPSLLYTGQVELVMDPVPPRSPDLRAGGLTSCPWHSPSSLGLQCGRDRAIFYVGRALPESWVTLWLAMNEGRSPVRFSRIGLTKQKKSQWQPVCPLIILRVFQQLARNKLLCLEPHHSCAQPGKVQSETLSASINQIAIANK